MGGTIQYGIAEQTFYRWKSKYGGMEVSEAKRLKQLEEENRRLKQLVGEQALDIQGLKYIIKKPIKPARGRLLVSGLKQDLGFSEVRACRLVGIGRSTYRYQAKTSSGNEDLRTRLIELALVWRRFGYRRLHALLAREGWHVNHKRVYRLYRKAGLAVRCRKRKRVMTDRGQPKAVVAVPNQRWSMDFVVDITASACTGCPIAQVRAS